MFFMLSMLFGEVKILNKKFILNVCLVLFFCLSYCGVLSASVHAKAMESGLYALVDGAWVLQPTKPSYDNPRIDEISVGAPVGTVDDILVENVILSPQETLLTQTHKPEESVDLEADEVEYDEENSLVSAIGSVELVQAGRIIRADKITYNLNLDQVEAIGNVVLNEVNGDTYFADTVMLKDKMKNGFVEGLSGALEDGSRFSAKTAKKIADLKLIMSKATYTACEPCKLNPSKAPTWQIKARNVTHHKDQARVSYNDATFEVAGLPVAYIPYFSHPDGSIDRKSGLLTPSLGFNSSFGAGYNQEYYWNIAPDKDATFGASIFTDEAPLLTGEYRQRFKNAEMEVQGGVTYSGRTDRIDDEDVDVDREERGHLFIEGLWNINEKWRAGTELQFVSDDQYLRQYDLSNEDILENTAYLERFDNRNYANARLINFKDVRVSDRSDDDQPNVLPELYAQFVGESNQLFGGRWNVETSFLGLRRTGDEQDVNRASANVGWQRRYVSNFGVVNTFDVLARTDVYDVSDRDTGDSASASALRGFAQAHLKSSYPVSKRLENSELVVEPIASLTVGTNLRDDDDIPNEDSQDVFLDVTNIFNANRFPGYDRIEDESSTTYGVRTGLYTDEGYKGELFFGQSYRFDDNDNPFPEGSGLSQQKSDFVGNVSVGIGPKLQLNYGMQFDSENLQSKRHEIDATTQTEKFDLSARYFYANALQGTDLDESREQITLSGRYRFTDKWSVLGGSQYDLAEETQGLRRLKYGLDYQGQCVNFLVTGQRTLTRDSSGDNGAEFIIRLGLKNLGEFETSSFKIGADENDDDDSEVDFLEDN